MNGKKKLSNDFAELEAFLIVVVVVGFDFVVVSIFNFVSVSHKPISKTVFSEGSSS